MLCCRAPAVARQPLRDVTRPGAPRPPTAWGAQEAVAAPPPSAARPPQEALPIQPCLFPTLPNTGSSMSRGKLMGTTDPLGRPTPRGRPEGQCLTQSWPSRASTLLFLTKFSASPSTPTTTIMKPLTDCLLEHTPPSRS